MAHLLTDAITDAFICDYIRTPIGRFGGALSSVRADDLAAIPLSALMARNKNVDWAALDDIYFGCANQAGEDNRNVARMAALLSGLPVTAPGVTLNRLCGSGLDSVATAARAIKSGEADLIIAGTESSDGYTGTVPEQMAEVLGLPSVTFAKTVEVADGTLKVDRQTEAGYDEVTCPLPAVVSVTAGVVEPRYPSFKGIMSAKSKPVENVTAADLGVESVSWAQQIVSVEDAPAREAGEVIEDDGETFNKIVEFLDELKVI